MVDKFGGGRVFIAGGKTIRVTISFAHQDVTCADAAQYVDVTLYAPYKHFLT